MYHPTTMLLLAQDRRSRLEHEAANERRAREAKAASRAAEHRAPRERFRSATCVGCSSARPAPDVRRRVRPG